MFAPAHFAVVPPAGRHRQARGLLCIALAAVCLQGARGAAAREKHPTEQAETPVNERLIDQTPHDEIQLKDGAVVQVEPIHFPNRKVPDKPRPGEKLVVHLLDRPDEAYEVAWRDVVQVRLFEQMVLDEAQRLAAAGETDKAYDYFDYLEQNYPQWPGAADAMQRYLYQDAQNWQRRKQYDYVLALLNQLYQRNPKFPSLDRALGIVTDKLIDAKLSQEEFQAAHALLSALAQKFPQDAQVTRLEEKLQKLADASLADAQSAAAAGRLRHAQELCHKALRLWPNHQVARSLLVKLNGEYPYVVVGVQQPLFLDEPRLDNWAAVRAGRLLQLPLVEFTGNGAEGGNYVSPFGSVEESDLGIRLTFRLRGDGRWSDGSPVTAIDVSRTLVERAGEEPSRRADWSGWIDTVEVPELFTAVVRFQRAPVQPEALFQTPLTAPRNLPAGSKLGLFRRADQDGPDSVYVSSGLPMGRSSSAPKEIVERRFERGRQALDALRRHEIAAIDRLNPWDVELARNQEGIVVESYAVPTIHCLLPNTAKPLLANRVFRRALVYGIHRAAILNVQILRGREMPLAQVTSGPFPSGYAYNDEVEVRPYEPRVAMMLASVALSEWQADEKRKAPPTQPPTSENDARPAAGPAGPGTSQPSSEANTPHEQSATATIKTPACPTLVLAHPADDVARLACRAIERQLALIKIPVRLVELKAGEVAPANGDYDLVYAEIRVCEPLIDAGRLFGPTGLAPLESAYLRATLSRLAEASDWRSAREALLQIHAIAADELPILPLYQLPEHLAYRRTIQGIGSQPASLYQNVGGWQIEPDLPSAE